MPSLIWDTLMIIFFSYSILFLLQIVMWPIVKSFLSHFPDEGWSTGRMIGILTVSLTLWELAYLGIPVNTVDGVRMGFLGLLFISGGLLIKKGFKWLMPNKVSLRIIVLEEYLFLIGFVAIAVVRSFLPNIDSLEKFMDYGFVVRYLKSPTLPAIDMWQAGSPINYYSFGHFWSSVVIRLLGVIPEIGYNLVLAFIAGVSMSLVFLACSLLSENNEIKKRTLLGGLLGSFLVVFGSNCHTIWYLIKNWSLSGYWYADATRFIHNTIHEFPGYSFVVSDLHGHLLDLPISIIFIVISFSLLKKQRLFEEIVLGLLFAVMMMTNTWDVPIYGMFLGLCVMGSLIQDKIGIKKALRAFVVVLVVMLAASALWLWGFQSISNGVALVTKRSPLWQLGVLWGGALILNLVAWYFSRKKNGEILTRSLILSSFFLVLIPELIYAKDIYPDHPRANTMFKLTYQASIMVGIVYGVLVNWIIEKISKNKRIIDGLLLSGVLIIFCGLMIFPTIAFPSYYANFDKFTGLNGEIWIKNRFPDKYQIIQYLKKEGGNKNLVEAVGDSYSDFNSISVFSGIPTVQGWRVHEWLWRGGFETVSAKELEVAQIYEGEDPFKTLYLLKKYNIGWIVVGPDEEEKYIVNHPKIREFGQEVWRSGDYYLLKVNDSIN